MNTAWDKWPAHPAEVQAVELDERTSRKVLRKEFGIDDGFEDSEPVWEITQTEADSILGTLSPRSTLRAEFVR